MSRHAKWWHTLQGSKNEACLAVDLYNRSTRERSLEGFVVHMHTAWLYLLHARFQRDDIDFRHWLDGRRLERVDGEPKTWSLRRCVREEYPDENDPVRRNVEFFIKLRDKIEHRYAEPIAAAVAGKTQAHVLNYEEALVERFGAQESLGDALRFPVFTSSLTPAGVTALKRSHRRLPKRLSNFIREYDASIPEEVQGDWRYDFRVLLLPQTGPKSDADAVVRFVREDEMTEEQRGARDVVQTIVREKAVPVQNKGKHKPSKVAAMVQEQLGVRFSTHAHHTPSWQHYRVRPEKNAARPEVTDERYCVWDEPHNDYLYTDAWVKKLVKDLADPKRFEEVTGHAPVSLNGKVSRDAARA
jgi:Domain of unknown function (DUF3644)